MLRRNSWAPHVLFRYRNNANGFLGRISGTRFGVTNPALLNVAELRRDTSSLETRQLFA
jgi:hypothetical protein